MTPMNRHMCFVGPKRRERSDSNVAYAWYILGSVPELATRRCNTECQKQTIQMELSWGKIKQGAAISLMALAAVATVPIAVGAGYFIFLWVFPFPLMLVCVLAGKEPSWEERGCIEAFFAFLVVAIAMPAVLSLSLYVLDRTSPGTAGTIAIFLGPLSMVFAVATIAGLLLGHSWPWF